MKAFGKKFDERLQVDRPFLNVDYEQLTEEERSQFELMCQEICAHIPEKIKEFEKKYMEKFEALKEAEEEEQFLAITDEMNELSSIICDLNLLFLYIEGTYIAKSFHA